jgi:Ca2+-binding RTX toxin-like protein
VTPRNTLRVALLATVLLGLIPLSVGLGATSTVAGSRVSKPPSVTIDAAALRPSQCSSIAPTTVLTVLTGGAAAELLLGTAAADSISAGGGNDCVLGGGGNDTINCGTGTDVAVGGPGTDTFNSNCETQIQ